MFKKTLKNIAILDLQNFTADSLRNIKKIKNCAMVIVPTNVSDEWKSAYTNINLENVAQIIEAESGKFSVLNGTVTLDDKNTNDDWLYIINGCCILETKQKVPELYVNGMLVKRKKSLYKAKSINGRSFEIDDDVIIKSYPNIIEIDSDTIKNYDSKTLIFAGNIIDIKNDVTEDMLRNKEISFVAGNEIKCKKSIMGYVKANADVGNKITEKNE